ncbi:hypothetical protein G9A89_022078 [Geosiphon pyriformis]|nr:hypothetical protein G9A89_022078 [Geosiphon pyriformis]
MVLSKKSVNGSWEFETDDTTEFNSVNMEEECFVEKTSVNYGERSLFNEGDSNQTPKSPRLVTKKTLGMPLEKIDFLNSVNDNDVFLDASVVFPLLLKNLVNVSVQKFFTVNISLDKVIGNLAQAIEKAKAANILVNTNLKKSTNHLDQAVVIKQIPIKTLTKTVHAVLFRFEMVKSIKIQLLGLWQKTVVEFKQLDYANLVIAKWDSYRILLYILLIEINAHNIWDFIGSVSGKMCVIDQHSVTNAQARCVCTKYEKVGHISLSCSGGRKFSSSGLSCKILSEIDKNRQTSIYAKCFAPIFCSVSFNSVSWAKIVGESLLPSLPVHNDLNVSGSFSELKLALAVSIELNNIFATFEHSFTSLVECIDKLAKRLNTSGLIVSQPSPGC